MKRTVVILILIIVALIFLIGNTIADIRANGGTPNVSEEQKVLERQGYTNVIRDYGDLIDYCGAEGVGVNFTATAPNGAVVKVSVCHEFGRPGYWLILR